jgi:hypothetical protein
MALPDGTRKGLQDSHLTTMLRWHSSC